MRDFLKSVGYNITALLWVLVMIAAWFKGISEIKDTSSVELSALIGGGMGVFTTIMTIIAQHIWRKKPDESH